MTLPKALKQEGYGQEADIHYKMCKMSLQTFRGIFKQKLKLSIKQNVTVSSKPNLTERIFLVSCVAIPLYLSSKKPTEDPCGM